MSKLETNFIKWLGGITATLVIALIVALFNLFASSVDVGVKQNSKDIVKVEIKHKDDINLLRDDIKEMRVDQKIIKEDIKSILQKI